MSIVPCWVPSTPGVKESTPCWRKTKIPLHLLKNNRGSVLRVWMDQIGPEQGGISILNRMEALRQAFLRIVLLEAHYSQGLYLGKERRKFKKQILLREKNWHSELSKDSLTLCLFFHPNIVYIQSNKWKAQIQIYIQNNSRRAFSPYVKWCEVGLRFSYSFCINSLHWTCKSHALFFFVC